MAIDNAPILTDRVALDLIQSALTLEEWDSDTTALIAEFVRLSGREILDPDEREDDDE
jgi:hypothetical protein